MAGHPTYHVNVIKFNKMRDYMDRQVTPPERVTSPTWGPPLPCKQALSAILFLAHGRRKSINDIFSCGS